MQRSEFTGCESCEHFCDFVYLPGVIKAACRASDGVIEKPIVDIRTDDSYEECIFWKIWNHVKGKEYKNGFTDVTKFFLSGHKEVA